MTTVAATRGNHPVWRIVADARPLRARMLVAVLAGAATVACGVGLFAVSGFLIARASEHPNEVALAVAVVAVRAFGIGRGLFRYLERLSSHDAAFRVLADLRVRVFAALERIAPAGLRGKRTGDLLNRLVSDVDAVQDIFIRGVTPPLVAFVVGGGAAVGLALIYLPAAAVLAAGLLLAGVLVPALVVRLAARAEQQVAAARASLATKVTDLLEGYQELVAFGHEQVAVAALASDDATLTVAARRRAFVGGLGAGLSSLMAGGTVWLLLLVAVAAATHGLDRIGVAVVVLTGLAAFEATNPLTAAAQQLASVRAGSRRVLEVLDAPTPVADPATPLPPPTAPIHLQLIGARARYGAAEPLALDRLSVDLPPGRRVALIGPSGAGKSTVASILFRFLDLDSGQALLNGQPLAAYAADDVRAIVGGAPADGHVFDSTIRENVRLARPDASQQQLDDVAERVRLLDFIQSLPLGWETPVGTHGAELSGGQAQRLMLARALLADPPILVLDEPTAHLDPDTSRELLADLLAATEGHTLLLITHDLEGIDGLDEIIRVRPPIR
ncbi:MAG TPA: thiol reductant ABC exporter subunit CydC [Mycobacteriales bacterium]|nr:thiol reductant ABC exporter subunit CydC [Mycobacteriales bacterium]